MNQAALKGRESVNRITRKVLKQTTHSQNGIGGRGGELVAQAIVHWFEPEPPLVSRSTGAPSGEAVAEENRL